MKATETPIKYPKKLYFLFVNVQPENFEFDASIKDGMISPGTYMEGWDEDNDDEEDFYEYGNYDCKRVQDYPLMVDIESIDDVTEEFYTHDSFGYYICSTKEKANALKEKLFPSKAK